MKTVSKFAVTFFLIAGMLISCKKRESSNSDSQKDSVNTAVDTVGPAIDSSATLDSGQNGKNGTTGATGEGSTGSGTEGSTQKGNQNVKTDSI